MIPHIAQGVELCQTCSLDSATVGNMVSLIIPSLEREAATLRSIREAFNAKGLAEWTEAGFVEEEQTILAALETARRRLGL